MAPTDVVSFCRICNAMCGVVVTVDGDRVLRVRGDEEHPLSRGYTCPKGRALGAFHHHPDRLDRPERAVGPARHVVGWDTQLDDLAQRLGALVEERGPDAVGMYLASGSAFDANGRRAAERLLAGLGSRQKYTATTVDTPCKPLVAELVGGWSGLTPIWDHERSRLLVLLGSNPVVSHGHSNAIPDPVTRLRHHRARGGTLAVVDPRRTETAALADVHLQARPGSDHVLLGHLVRELLTDPGRGDKVRPRATGVDELTGAVAGFTLGATCARTGLAAEEVTGLLAAVRRAGRVSALTGTGSSMARTANVTEWLLWALHVVTDSYDHPGGMWFNPGYLSQLDEREWHPSDGVPDTGPRSRPELPRRFGEYPCAGLVDEIEAGHLRALLVVGGNPVTALPDHDRTVAALRSLDVLAVADVVGSETTALATHVLPAAGQLERADVPWLLDAYQLAVATQYTPAVVAPAQERRPVWRIMAELGDRLGVPVLPRGVDLATADDEALVAALARRSRGGAEAVLAARHGAVHSGAVFGWVTDRVLPEGGWRLAPPPLVAQLAELEAEHRRGRDGGGADELLLLPQRRLRTMNSQLRDTASPGGRTERADVVLSPADAAARGILDGAEVAVSSRHGSTRGPARVDERMAPGSVGVPHGWAEPDVCALTDARDVDALTGMPTQSGIPVRVAVVTVDP